eukprot:CAMPEP_0119269260 /NCGR_PEP_ID=MMETSP1329-20130426/6744_1 /TAXON_ID=114041 /ORGANISM="Genus nov. species nov., Strain RCC1024" /LENGTH=61 /DNA_ID=CAMNT_0007269257 /DNA_START=44 /DNA_END=226 /DNA_ORIENTATION=+
MKFTIVLLPLVAALAPAPKRTAAVKPQTAAKALAKQLAVGAFSVATLFGQAGAAEAARSGG